MVTAKPSSQSQADDKGLIVLLHGILRSRTDMLPLSRFFKKQGYETANILYPSRILDLKGLSEFVAEKIRLHTNYRADRPLHFVTHSMGGLIARYYIDRYAPENLGRVVMLSPPNMGSDLADALDGNIVLGPLYRRAFGPASGQLTTKYLHTDAAIAYPLGIIAGSRSINPLSPFLLSRRKFGPHDGIVPVARTKIEGMSDHITLPTTHTFMMFNPAVMRQTLCFLQNGRFKTEE
ncbi:MAG: alpha/beta hydrolase [Alphaproteobacteria bacterium]|nr:alpha/beta hydrolase [Alphaproteobacteria bacterium]